MGVASPQLILEEPTDAEKFAQMRAILASLKREASNRAPDLLDLIQGCDDLAADLQRMSMN